MMINFPFSGVVFVDLNAREMEIGSNIGGLVWVNMGFTNLFVLLLLFFLEGYFRRVNSKNKNKKKI